MEGKGIRFCRRNTQKWWFRRPRGEGQPESEVCRGRRRLLTSSCTPTASLLPSSQCPSQMGPHEVHTRQSLQFLHKLPSDAERCGPSNPHLDKHPHGIPEPHMISSHKHRPLTKREGGCPRLGQYENVGLHKIK